MRKTLLALSLLSLLAYAGCGGEDPLDKAIRERAASGGGGGGAAGPARTATLKGKIAFDGQAPAPKKLVTSSDPGCKNSNLVAETPMVVSDGGLENVIIYVSGGDITKMKFPPNKEQKTLSQEGCHYVPHALTLQVNQPLNIVNNDDTAHNIHVSAEINKGFNESQASKGVMTVRYFEKEEVLVPVRCDVHNWMNAFIGVFNHPLSTVSGKGGAYELMLPAGTYTITAEHETLGRQEMMVTVAENGSADLNFTFKPKA